MTRPALRLGPPPTLRARETPPAGYPHSQLTAPQAWKDALGERRAVDHECARGPILRITSVTPLHLGKKIVKFLSIGRVDQEAVFAPDEPQLEPT